MTEKEPTNREIMQTLESFMGTMNHEIGGIKQEISTMNHEIGGIKQEISTMNQEIGGIKQEIGGIKQEIQEVKDDLKEAKEEREEIAVTLAGFMQTTEDNFTLAKAERTDLKNDVTTGFADLKKELRDTTKMLEADIHTNSRNIAAFSR